MKLNKFFGLGILVLALMVIPLVSATTTLNVPLANNNYTGTISFNCTTSLNASDANYNVSLMYNVSGGTAGTVLETVSNTSQKQSEFVDTSVLISGLTDAATYNLSCYADNGSDQEYSTGIDGITFDSTAPIVGLSIDLDGEFQSFGRGIEYSCTTSDGIDSGLTETFSVAHPSEDETSSTTLALQSVKQLFTDTDYPGDFVFTCTSTDYAGNSASDTATVTIDSLGKAHISSSGNGGIDSKWIWVIIGLLLFWIWSSSKK